MIVFMAWPMAAQDKELPRVLVIGDAVYSQHARGVSADLKGRAEVVMATVPAGGVLNSTTALEHLEQLLGHIDRNGKTLPEGQRPTWDLIHINVGLGDLIHVAPNMKSFRAMPIDAGGVLATSREQYKANLDELVTKLKATGAKIVWASTTPIRDSRNKVFKLGTEIEYNAIAECMWLFKCIGVSF